MATVTFITGNASKADQLRRYLNLEVNHRNVDVPEIQSLDLSEVISEKAKEAYKIVGTPVIVDDVSLVLHSLGRLPGPFIKYFLKEIGNANICKIASSFADKSAIAEVCVGYYDGTHIEICSGFIKGTIATEPRGNGGFGWDQIFIPENYSQTRAEMSESDYDATSPRKSALDKLNIYLKSII